MLPTIPDLTTELWALARQIPAGNIATYGDLAKSLGDVAASRYVGHVMLHHNHTSTCICHRVVRADGSVGKFISGDVNDKIRALANEHVVVENQRVQLESYRFLGFISKHPLKQLADFQRVAAQRSQIADVSSDSIKRIGGVDLSYVAGSKLAVAALVDMDLCTRKVWHQQLITRLITFPYVTSYLAFRELPILTELINEYRKHTVLPDVIMVDGSGILHPRRAGIATMLGVATGVKTIGITKKHLAGQVKRAPIAACDVREITLDGELSGYAVLPGSGTQKPLYVSPGFGVDVQTSLSILQQTLLGRRLPEPIYWADRVSREATKRQALTQV